MRPASWRLLAAFAIAAELSAAEPNWKRLLQNADWFGLRAAASSAAPPEYYRAVLAATFDREDDALPRLLKLTASPRDRVAAHETLLSLHLRHGRYRSALREIEALLALKPNRRDLRNARDLFGPMAALGDLEVAQSGPPSPLSWRTIDGNLFIPVTVNGQPGEYLLDTGANLGVMSAGEARRLGMDPGASHSHGKDISGRNVALQSVAAAEVRIGGLVFRNVGFGVVPDDKMPFNELKEGQRGVIGLPLILAAGVWRWAADGPLEAGAAPGGCPAEGNLAFSGSMPLVRTEVQGAPMVFRLDTGAQSTHLWAPFVKRFPLPAGSRRKVTVTGVGGESRFPGGHMPEVELRLGGGTVKLKDVQAVLRAAESDYGLYAGNLGLDMLGSLRRLILDFRGMCVTAE